MKTDNVLLAEMVDLCFDYSMDGRFDQSQRREFLTLGKRLRGIWLNIATAQFDEGTVEVQTANAELQSINIKLKAVTNDIQKTADIINQLGQLVKIFDELLALAVSFL